MTVIRNYKLSKMKHFVVVLRTKIHWEFLGGKNNKFYTDHTWHPLFYIFNIEFK